MFHEFAAYGSLRTSSWSQARCAVIPLTDGTGCHCVTRHRRLQESCIHRAAAGRRRLVYAAIRRGPVTSAASVEHPTLDRMSDACHSEWHVVAFIERDYDTECHP